MHMLYIENVPCSHYNFRSLFTNENGQQAKRQRQRRSSRWAAFHTQISDCLSTRLFLSVCVCGCVTTAVSSAALPLLLPIVQPVFALYRTCVLSLSWLDLAWPPRRVGVKIAIIHRFNGVAANTCLGSPLCWALAYSAGISNRRGP